MNEYTGSRCPVCSKKFTDSDDIVVCPVCGAPHHRECYQELGECAFEEEHISGKPWAARKPQSNGQTPKDVSEDQTDDQKKETVEETPKEQPATQQENSEPVSPRSLRPTPRPNRPGSRPSDSGKRICNSCGTENPETNLFCNLCGNWLGDESRSPRTAQQSGDFSGMFGMPITQQLEQQMQYDPRFALYGGLSPDEKIGDHSAHDVATYVGKSSSHYLPRFKAISDTGKTMSVNLSAFFFHAFYFLYRKMYAIGAILLIIFIITSVPTMMYLKEALLFEAHVLEVGVDEQGRPVVPYDDVAMAQLQRYEQMSSQTRTIFLIISAITSFMANRLYYEHSMRKITKTLKPFREEGEALNRCIPCENALSKAGGVSIPAVVVSAVLVILGASAYVAYQLFLQ